MRVLLTGGTGQLGAAIARALTGAGHEVTALVRDLERPGLLAGTSCRLARGDITQPGTLTAAARGVEAVVHTAGLVSYAAKDAAALRAVNVEGTRAVLDAAAAAGARRLVLTSSIAALGEAAPGELGDEETPWRWGGQGLHYLESKFEAERLALSDARLEVIALNPGIVFGRDDLSGHTSGMFSQVRRGGPPVVPCGATTVCALPDVAAAHVSALTQGRPGQRYVLGGVTPSFLELYAAIAASVGGVAPARVVGETTLRGFAVIEGWLAWLGRRKARITPALARMSSRNRRYSCEKAVTELGYQTRPLEACLAETLNWMRDQGLIKV
ncbi:NAD-dependent epimerase/dehydratase family protein [Myxococcota bacterium]|nr:NAD-dependent epimerase/dehydratase family protein [Myxococcota bacterium]